MSLDNSEKKSLKRIGHHLNPVVIIAQKGLTENVIGEIDRALRQHELIKVKIVSDSKADRKAVSDEICTRLDATCIQSIGHIVLLYKKARQADPRLSNISRHKSSD